MDWSDVDLGSHAEGFEQQFPDHVEEEQSYCEEEDRKDHHNGRTDEFGTSGPTDLCHLGFDGDQKIGEFWPIDEPKADPCESQKDSKWNSNFSPAGIAEGTAEKDAQPPAAEGEHDPNR